MPDPTDFTFNPASIDSYFDPQPANLIDGTEAFASDTGQFTQYTEGTAGTFSVTGGEGRIVHSTGGRSTIVTRTTATLSLPQVFISVEIPSIPVTSSGYDNAFVGLYKDGANFVAGHINRDAGAAAIVVTVAGVQTVKGVVFGYTWTAPLKIGFSLVGTQAVLWADVGGGWSSITGAFINEFNPQAVGGLTGYKAGFEVSSQNASEWRFDNLVWGRFGGVGMRDHTMVTNEDGSVYEVGNDVYFTATLPDALGGGYSGVFVMDMTTFDYEQVAVVMVERSGNIYPDGGVLHLVRTSGGDFHVTFATWGTLSTSLKVRYKLETTLDLLSGARVLQSTTELNLPGLLTSAYGAYDQFLVFDSANTRWLLAYIITETRTFASAQFYAALAESADLVTWNLIGTDTANKGWEGAKLLFYDSAWWVLVGGPAGSGNSSRVYNASMVHQGALMASFNGGGDTQPHPMVFEWAGFHYLLSFNSTRHGGVVFTWGQPTLQVDNSLAPSFISGVSNSQTQQTLTITPNPNATNHAIYGSIDPAFVVGALTLIASGLGATPAPYVRTGLAAGTEYFYLVRNTIGASNVNSPKIKVTTPGVAAAPDLRLVSLAATSAVFSVNNDAAYLETRFQRTLSTDAGWMSTPQSNAQSTSASRYSRTESGLTTAVNYVERAQARLAAGWTDWSANVLFTPVDPPPFAGGQLPGGNIFIRPKFEEPVPGAGSTLVTISWFTALGTATLLEWSPIYSSAWTTITTTGLSTGTYLWDVSAIANGTLVRVRITIGGTVYEHPGFFIDKTDLQQFWNDDMPGNFDGWAPFGDATATYAMRRYADFVCSSYTGPAPEVLNVWAQLGSTDGLAIIAPVTLSPATADGARVSATGAIFTGGGTSGFWEFYYPAEHAKFGVGVALQGSNAANNTIYIAAYVLHGQLGHPIGQCPGGTGIDGTFNLSIFSEPDNVNINFSVPLAYVAASYRPFFCGGTCYEKIWPYHVSLEWERTAPPANEVRLRAWLGAPYSILIDQTVEVHDASGDPVTFDCGYAGIVSEHQAFSFVNNGFPWRQIYNFGLYNFSTACGPPPPVPPPPVPVPFPAFVPCVTKMTFFEDDRVTERFAVATHPLVALPYMVQPADGDYSPQSVDFLNGGATLGEFTGRVVDRPQIVSPVPDQDGGFFTEKLTDAQNRGAILNGRVQVILFGDDGEGFVAADGDAAAPSLNTYASFEVQVRDTRERERKYPAFQRGITSTVLPRGVLFPDGRDAYGYLPGIAGAGAIPNVLYLPLVARAYHDFPKGPSGYQVLVPHCRLSFEDGWNGLNEVEDRRLIILPESEKAGIGEVESSRSSSAPGTAKATRIRFRFPNVVIWWRVHGLSEPNPWYRVKPRKDLIVPTGPYTIPNIMNVLDTNYVLDRTKLYPAVAAGPRGVIIIDGDREGATVDVRAVRDIILGPLLANDHPPVPGGGQLVDVIVQYVGETSEHFPYHYCDILGNYIQDSIDGEFGPRLPTPGLSANDRYWLWDDGVPIPTGIEVDPDQLALLTENVLLRQTEPVDDLRDFNEKYGYKPSGWAPCIDRTGRLSPLHRAPPADFTTTPLVDNAVVKPDTGWRAGETIVNVIDATYRRLFNEPYNADGLPTGAGDGVEEQKVHHLWVWDNTAPVVVTSPEPLAVLSQSVNKHGVHTLEMDAKLFSIDEFSDIPFDITQEEPYLMLQRQAQLILPRYAWGTPTVNLETRSTALAGKRAGDWVRLRPTWMPEYQTLRRGMSRQAQIISLNPLNCKWFGVGYELGAWLEEIASAANALESGVGFSFGESAYTSVADISSANGFSFGEAVYTSEGLLIADSAVGFSFGEAVYSGGVQVYTAETSAGFSFGEAEYSENLTLTDSLALGGGALGEGALGG